MPINTNPRSESMGHPEEPVDMVNVLLQANKLVHHDRRDEYGEIVPNMEGIGRLMANYLFLKYPNFVPLTLTGADVAILMILVKIARHATGLYREDTYVDIAGYAEIANICCRAKMQLPKSPEETTCRTAQ